MVTCPFCRSQANEIQRGAIITINCPVCSEFLISREAFADFPTSRYSRYAHKISVYLRHRFAIHLPIITVFQDADQINQYQNAMSYEEIIAQFPRTINERIEKVIQNFAGLSRFTGEYIEIEDNDQTLFYGDTSEPEATFFMMQLLLDEGLLEDISATNRAGLPKDLRLTAKGWQKAMEIEQGKTESNEAFVAMWFNEEMNEPFIVGIMRAISDAGFIPIRVDMQEHNGKICDQIIMDIKKCKFAVCDFTGHRGGVYFEAGFAMGLGKPVIWTCRGNDIENAHFDTRQYNHIVWQDPEDLYQKLYRRIKATID
ncbi:MAG: nucleoside 2-deoxyribosyltransferase family protein [Clostridia bacterium]|nr:nucleoside 2-deoxyribosyltransferase family protein [Clostridia bacterium]